MIINHDRDKLINAILYFLKETSLCHKIKLYKLLYHLDFEHYAQTGRSVTGLNYYAWPKGPVPKELEDKKDLDGKVEFKQKQNRHGNWHLEITAKTAFDPTCFTKRELAILKDVSYRYALDSAEEMIESTHLPSQPWHLVYNEQGKKQQFIPYEYVLSQNPLAEEIRIAATEHEEVLANYL